MYSAGGDVILVATRNYPVVSDKSELKVTYNGADLPADKIEVVLSSSGISNYKITTPAVSNDVASVVFGVTSVTTGEGDTFRVESKLPPSLQVATFTPPNVFTFGGTVTVRMLYLMHRLTQQNVDDGDLTAKLSDASGTQHTLSIAAIDSAVQTATKTQISLTFPTGLPLGAATVTVSFVDHQQATVSAAFGIRIRSLPLLRPRYMDQKTYSPTAILKVVIARFARYFTNPADVTDSITAVFKDKDGNSLSHAAVTVQAVLSGATVADKQIALAVTIPHISSIVLPQRVSCTLSATGMSTEGLANAVVPVVFSPPRVPKLVFQSRVQGTQAGKQVVVLDIEDLTSFSFPNYSGCWERQVSCAVFHTRSQHSWGSDSCAQVEHGAGISRFDSFHDHPRQCSRCDSCPFVRFDNRRGKRDSDAGQ
jgi:hypothetical protein